MRFYPAILAASLTIALSGCSEPGNVAADVKLKRAAAGESEVLAVIPKGSAIKVRTCTNGWCLVSWNGREGYVLTKYLTIGKSRSNASSARSDDPTDEEDMAVPDSAAQSSE
jgi:uncharacterized protein YraI